MLRLTEVRLAGLYVPAPLVLLVTVRVLVRLREKCGLTCRDHCADKMDMEAPRCDMDKRQNMEIGARPMRMWNGYILLAFTYLHNVPPTSLVLLTIKIPRGPIECPREKGGARRGLALCVTSGDVW